MKKLILAFLALFSVGTGVLIAVLVPRYVKREVIAEAEARGIELVPGQIRFGLGWLKVADAQLSLIGVSGFTATVNLIDAELNGRVPSRFTLDDFRAEATGDAASFLRDLESWRGAHENNFPEPVFIKRLTFSMRPSPKAAPLLTLGGGEMRTEQGRTSLRTPKLTVLGRELGAASVSAAKGAVRAGLTFGMSSLENPLVTLVAQSSLEPSLHFGLSPIALAKLGAFLGREWPLPDVLLSGGVDVKQAPNTTPPAGLSGRA